MILRQKDIELYLQKDVFKNKIIKEKKGDVKIENLIREFSLKVEKKEMKYYPAVRTLETIILKNITNYKGDFRSNRKKRNLRKTQRAYVPIKKVISTKHYIMGSINYSNDDRTKFDKEQENKQRNRENKFAKTRIFTTK